MKNSILGKARWLRDVALATSKNNGARVAREWLKYAAMFVMLFTIGSGNAWGEEITYTFSSKSWAASPENWTSNTDGSSFESTGSARGVANNGVNGACTSPITFANVSSISIVASSNTTGGKVAIKIGDTQIANKSIENKTNATYTYNSADYPSIANLSGNVQIVVTKPKSKSVWVKSITITYSAVPAYTVVWTINPAAGGSLSTTSGTSTTVTPNSAYTYGSPAYTVTTGSATVLQNTNTFTATPTSNCSIRINMVERPKFTVTLMDDGDTRTQASAGASVTLPSRDGCAGYTFAGWTKTWVTDQKEWTTTAPTIIPAESYTPMANENLYPVYTKTEGGGEPVETKTQEFQYDTWEYGGSSTDKSSYRLFHDGGYVESASDVDFSKLSKVIVYGGTFGGTSYNKISIKKADRTLWKNATVSGTSQTGTNTITGGESLTGSAKLRVYSISGTASGTGVRISKVEVYTMEGGTTTSYISVPNCCTNNVPAPTVIATNTAYTVTLTWAAVDGATGYEVSWNGGAFTAATSPCVKSGLTASTDYIYKVRATYDPLVKCGALVASGNVTTDDVYSVTYSGGTGTGSCSPTGSVAAVTYEAGATVTLAATNSFSLTSNTFAAWVVKDAENNDVAVSNNQFTMPASNVTVTATWTAVQDKYYDRMHQSTDASQGGIADGNGKYYIVREGCNYTVPSSADDSTGDTDCHTTHFKLLGWIAQSHLKSDGSIKDGEESHLFQGGTIKSATGATYYAIYAIMTE